MISLIICNNSRTAKKYIIENMSVLDPSVHIVKNYEELHGYKDCEAVVIGDGFNFDKLFQIKTYCIVHNISLVKVAV